MRKSIILVIALAVALVAVPAFASTQNVKISGSIDSTWLSRNNFDLGDNTVGGINQVEDRSQSMFFTQTTVQIDADLTDQVSTTVGLINERVWDQTNDSNADSGLDIYLAYVTLREMLYSPLTVVAGRQVFSYGNSLIVDATGTNNAAPASSGLTNAADLTKETSLDAIRLIFDYNPLTLELLYAKIDEGTQTIALDNVVDDADVWGINATYELGDDMDTVVEGYFFSRIIGTNLGVGGDSNKADTLYVPGLRASANVLDGLNVQGEVAWQRGNNVTSSTTTRDNNEQREAFAAQFVSNYQIPNDILPDALEEYNPVLGYTYTYVSGDSNPADRRNALEASSNKDTAWDPFLENQGGGTIYNALFNLSNLQIHAVSLTVNPMEDVTTSVTWSGLWLDKKLDETLSTLTTLSLNSVDGGTFTPTVDKTETHVGNEVDFNATYDYTEDVQFGANLGWFMPGDLFASHNDAVASQAILHGNVNF